MVHVVRLSSDLGPGLAQPVQHELVGIVAVQHGLGHVIGDQAGEVHPAKELLFIGLFGEQTLKLPGTGDPTAKAIDRIALGLTWSAQDEQVFPGEKGNGDHLHQFCALSHIPVHILDHCQHFVSQHGYRPPTNISR